MKRLAGLSALALIVTSSSACSWLWGKDGYFRDRGTDYLEARQVPPIQLPEGVQAKRLDPLLPIPQNVPSSTETPDQFEVPRPQPLPTLAEGSDFSLQQSGTSRWLLAQRPPAEVWPMVRQFFEDNGLRIDQERPETGEFVTAWQRLDELSAEMAARLRSHAAADAQVRLRVRIEPGVQRDSSEIYVTSVERPAGSSAEVPFPTGSANAELESVMLDEMLASLASSARQGGSVSLLAARQYDAPSRVSLTEDGNGKPVLNLAADFDRAWSSVGRALEKGDVRVDDVNRSLGVYYINLAEKARRPEERPGLFGRLFGGEPSKEEVEARAQRYQVRLTPVGDSVQIAVEKDANTVAPDDVARRVLNLIQENLGA